MRSKIRLSAIKSIAQVMREDDELSVEYARDLSLIVGETDRLSQSVTQLLSFARRQSVETVPLRVDELVHSVVDLFRANAGQQKVRLITRVETDRELPGVIVPAVRDALSNLVLNALQAIPEGGKVSITAGEESARTDNPGQDSGPGISKCRCRENLGTVLYDKAARHGPWTCDCAQAHGRSWWLSSDS